MDYLDIDAPDLREQLRRFIDQPYYWTCGRCDGYHEMCEAMEQGYHDFTNLGSTY